jgi:outer membrane protein OmpU
MKKALYGTSALVGVLALGAADATAAAMKIGVSGFFNSRIGIASQAGSFEDGGVASGTSGTYYGNFDVKNDSEVVFSGSSKLDNGITVSVNMQLETDNTSHATAGSAIDESSLKLTGSFGDLRLGTIDGASQTLRHTAPGGGVGAIGIGGGDAAQWIIRPAAIAGAAAGSTGFDGGGDSMKILYISPKMNGWRVGGTYAPSTTHGTNMAASGGTAGTEAQQMDVVVSFENKVGAIDLKADVAHARQSGTTAASRNVWRGGVNVGFGNLTVGGSYLSAKDSGRLTAGTAISSTANANEAWDMGAQYQVSKDLSVSAVYLAVKSPQTVAITGDDKSVRWIMSAGYAMGPGVSLGGTLLHVDWEDEATTAASNNDGYALIGAVKVKF